MTAIVQDVDLDAPETRHSVLLGKTVNLAVPNFFGSGYRWDFVADAGALKVCLAPADATSEGDDPAPGDAPPVVFAVTPLVPGEHKLGLELRRPWEDAPRRTLDLRIMAHRPNIFD